MNIVYLAFGKRFEIPQQAIFSILTILPHVSTNDRIIVLTDNPENFNLLKGKVDIVAIDDEQIQSWTGEQDFFWRVKIKALQFIVEKFNNAPILYLDSDTFLIGDLKKIKLELQNGNNLMHLNEGKLSKSQKKTEQRTWKKLKGTSHEGITIDSEKAMWNAGVVGISERVKETLDLALSLCDSMLKTNPKHPSLLEQFSFSISLGEHATLLPIEDCIGHYWGNKNQWNDLIGSFFITCHLSCKSLKEQIDFVQNMKFGSIPVHVKTTAIRIRYGKLVNLVSQLLPKEEKKYVIPNN
ncbi:hypothetical protein [Reichenbachiella sp. MALMAid0571]|uniref:hypothetical protein n=1 Tax=Reichenbachiella sp. MALMAid0571 TaxID=3143939 RepID=UPI0032DE5BDA